MDTVPIMKIADIPNGMLETLFSWSKFRERWNEEIKRSREEGKPAAVPVLNGLLHKGWDAQTFSVGEEVERVCFYLETANEFRLPTSGPFSGTPPSPDPTSEALARWEISKKAWRELCEHFFKNRSEAVKGAGFLPSWARLLREPMVLLKVLSFFDPETKRGKLHLPSPVRNHHDELAWKFLSEMTVFVWDMEPATTPRETLIFSRACRSMLIRILRHLDQLDVLLDLARNVREVDIAQLELLALRECPDPKPVDMEDAYLDRGCKTAMYPLLLRMREEKRRRQTAEKVG